MRGEGFQGGLRSGAAVLLACLLLCLPMVALADETPPFRVLWADTQRAEGIYLLDARIDYRLAPNLREALHNGVRLTFEMRVEITRQRDWLWDETVAGLTQGYRLEYHPLSRLYLLTSLNTGVQRSFQRLESALARMGQVEALPLLDAALLEAGTDYRVRLRAYLRVDALPLPLRLRGYLLPDWKPESDWYTWPLD
ncbi:DUF4390 domain-containing protein [Ectothiorhodospira mobilis]|uniref:DUF4390 domain-containing protein n=1 Tax=Ectothiorhodospira mobilis TaxID=195064 RepID=UPI001EE8AECE|nr:DUF4390 domain-containing protein [Ectothiorhodospira mobilis]MCG5535970.1 DUF4390 domain-containing protein [Ectothiorhodospira mobilis]